MARTLDRLITIFPFEKTCFDGTGLRVDFVGHPLVDEAARTRAEPPAEPLSPGALAIQAYEAGRPSEAEACRIGDARFLTRVRVGGNG
jgi:lipid A disaccharide synthetase